MMRLLVTTPTAVAVDRDDVRHVRAEDSSGAFGVLPGHADLITVLEVAVLSWRTTAGAEGHVAVRGGVCIVGGDTVRVATREAVTGADLEVLEANVLASFRADVEAEALERQAVARLELAAIRHLLRYLKPAEIRPADGPAPGGVDRKP